MSVSASESQLPLPTQPMKIEVEFAKCYCCGLTEECTPAYIARIRERYRGRWICGLCSEAVKDEIGKSEELIGMEEGLNRHMNFCKKFNTSPLSDSDPTVHLISAMRQLLRRSFDSPRALRSTPGSPLRAEEDEIGGSTRSGRKLVRAGSCFSSLGG